MEEPLLRDIADQYLVPLFSGARLQRESEKSPARAARVTLKDANCIAFKVNRSDAYKLVLRRRQSFAGPTEALVSEFGVVRAFVDVLRQIEGHLTNDHLTHDLLSSFQRRIVARAVISPDHADMVLEGIDLLARWANRLYEGAPISSAIGFRRKAHATGAIRLSDLGSQDFGAVLSNGQDTLLEFNFAGRFVSHEYLDGRGGIPPFCPIRQAPVAHWTEEYDSRIALTLNRLGEILVFRDQQLLFARRSARWSFLTHNPVINQMGKEIDLELRRAIYETCLDASFARKGACFGVIFDSTLAWQQTVVASPDYVQTGSTPKARAVRQIVAGRKFHEIPRLLRQELAALDGATVMSADGNLIAVGTILRIEGGDTGGGGRQAAAKALGQLGLGIKVSQDGRITGFRSGEQEHAFQVM